MRRTSPRCFESRGLFNDHMESERFKLTLELLAILGVGLAARHGLQRTHVDQEQRRLNFCLPEWLAKDNNLIFGVLMLRWRALFRRTVGSHAKLDCHS